MKVPIEYRLGVSSGSMPSLERRNKGIEADRRVDIVEWRSVTGAIENGINKEGKDFKVRRIERGGWVEGVSMIFVLAMSKGASIQPAMPAAETATRIEVNGAEDDRISSPPA